MVHTFNFDENYYIFDSESGALFTCDALTSELIKRELGETCDLNGYSEAEIAASLEEINTLRARGDIFAPETKARPMKSKYVKALCLHISHDCNLACKYCFAGEGEYHGKREHMPFLVAKAAIDFLIENSGDRKTLEVDFFGGEPLMNFEVVKQTVEYAKIEAAKRGKRFLFTLTTNGVLLKGEIAEYLDREMENLVLSLDGRKCVHDAVRRTRNDKGSFDVVYENIKDFAIKRGDKNYFVRGTFTAKNLDFSEDVMFLASEGFKHISFEPVVLEGGGDMEITKEMLPLVVKEYKNLARKYITARKEGKAFDFFHFQIDLEGGVCLSKRVSACGAGNEYFSVTPNGDLYPCHRFAGEEQYVMGNVLASPVTVNEELRSIFRDNNLFTRKGCENCFARYQCSGGCAYNNIHFSGDVNKPYEDTCTLMKARTECALHIYNELKVKGQSEE